MQKKVDRLCGLVVRVSGYTTEMYCAFCEVYVISEEKVAAPVYKSENTAVGILHTDHVAASVLKNWH
jgi:hypothetical protein